MNKILLKKVAEKYIPPFFLDFCIHTFCYTKFIFYPHKNLLLKNKELKNKGINKRAFLIATGPSIKNQNLSLLKGEDCYSVSNFFLHQDIKEISPKIHFFAPYHKPLVLDNYAEWLKQADQILPPETKICLGHTTKKIVEKYSLFPNREIFYLYITKAKASINLLKPIMGPQTGPLMILPVLLNMGYSEIYLIGCDHTVLRDYKKNITNFYNTEEDIRQNAINKDSWENIIESHKSHINIFYQYEMYKKIAKKNNIKIINLSTDTWLDTFPIDSFKKLIEI